MFTRISMSLRDDIENLHELNAKLTGLRSMRQEEASLLAMHEAQGTWESFHAWLDSVDRVHLARMAVLGHRFPGNSPFPGSSMAERRAA